MTAAPSVVPDDWARLHMVTPVLTAGRTIGVFVIIGMAQAGPGGWRGTGTAPAWVVLAAFALVVVVVIAISFTAWRMNEFRVDDDAVHQRKGILFRQYRQARLDRLQAVDVVQPLIARVFGFAELRIEVAGGRASGVRLQYLRLDDAEALRNEIVSLAAGIRRTAVDAPVAAASEREVYQVPPGRLIGSILASWWTLFIVGLVVAVVVAIVVAGADEVEEFAEEAVSSGGGIQGFLNSGAYGILSGLFAFFAVGWARFSSGFGFTAGISADGIRLQHGLLDTRRQTVPPGRVQAVRLRQPLPWRRFDWWRITINVAGYQDEQEAVSTLLPVGPKKDALYALWLVLPDLGDPDPAGTISAALSGTGSQNGFTAIPRRAWVVDPLQWRRRGVLATGRALLIRQGLFARDVVVVPHEKTQSLSIRQGPLQRLLSLATVEVHSTRGTIRPVAHHLDLADAIALLDAQATRAREARERQTPEQWMATVQG